MKHRIRDTWKDRLPAFVRTHTTRFTANEKDFSLTLEMTRGKRIAPHSLSYRRIDGCLSDTLYPAPSSRGVLSTRRSTMHLCKSVKGLHLAHVRLSLLSYRHRKRSRGIFALAASLPALLIHLHETPYPPMHGKAGFPFPFTRIHRFSANEKDFSLALEMTMQESDVS